MLPAAGGKNRKISVHALHVRVGPAGAGIGTKAQIFLDRQADEGSSPFRHMGHAQRCDLFGRAPIQPFAGEQDFAFAAHRAADGAQRRRLAGAIGAEQHRHAAFLDIDVEPVHDLGLAVEGL